jgi:hypothetical protein
LFVRHFDKEYGDVGLDGELLARGRVDFPISIQHDLAARKEAFGTYDFGRIGVTGQCDRLPNGRNRATDCAIFNLFSVTIIACSDSCCETGEESDPLLEVGTLKVRVHSHRSRVLLPVVPILFPAAGGCLQSSRVKGVIRKTEITCVAIAEVGWQTVHEFCNGSVKF